MKQIEQNSNAFGYKGVVTLKILKGNKLIRTITAYNEGSKELFRIIISQLCGNNESSKLPQYLDIIRVDGSSGLLNRVFLTGVKADTVDNIPCAYFSALIPANQFIKRGIDIIKFALYNSFISNVDTYLAQVSLTQEQIDELNKYVSTDPGIQRTYSTYNLLVEWRMFISNADVSRLATPVVTVASNTASWANVPNASSYNVMVIKNGTARITTQPDLTIELDTELDTEQKIQVQAISDTSGYIDSLWSTVETLIT